MSRPVLTESMKQILLNGWPSDLPERENPFVDGALRFDSIRFEDRTPNPGIRFVLSFAGRDVAVVALEDYVPGMVAHLSGIDGTLKVRLSN